MLEPLRLEQAGFKTRPGYTGTPVGLLRPVDLGGTFNGGSLLSGQQAVSPLINVAGYNSFMATGFCTAGAGYTVKIGQVDYGDLVTPFAIVNFDSMGNITPVVGRQTAGAGSAVRATDTWGWIQLQLTGLAATGATDIFVTLLCSTR